MVSSHIIIYFNATTDGNKLLLPLGQESLQ